MTTETVAGSELLLLLLLPSPDAEMTVEFLSPLLPSTTERSGRDRDIDRAPGPPYHKLPSIYVLLLFKCAFCTCFLIAKSGLFRSALAILVSPSMTTLLSLYVVT